MLLTFPHPLPNGPGLDTALMFADHLTCLGLRFYSCLVRIVDSPSVLQRKITSDITAALVPLALCLNRAVSTAVHRHLIQGCNRTWVQEKYTSTTTGSAIKPGFKEDFQFGKTELACRKGHFCLSRHVQSITESRRVKWDLCPHLLSKSDTSKNWCFIYLYIFYPCSCRESGWCELLMISTGH